jgi:hypothetical protein
VCGFHKQNGDHNDNDASNFLCGRKRTNHCKELLASDFETMILVSVDVVQMINEYVLMENYEIFV